MAKVAELFFRWTLPSLVAILTSIYVFGMDAWNPITYILPTAICALVAMAFMARNERRSV